MKIYTIERMVQIAAPIQAVFAFHLDFKNLELISPSWMRSELLDEQGMGGAKVMKIRVTQYGVFSSIWVVKIDEYDPPMHLTDLVVSGPLPYFRHSRSFIQPSEGCTELTDKLEYALPFGFIGSIANKVSVRKMMEQMFEHRHRMTKALLEEKYVFKNAPSAS